MSGETVTGQALQFTNDNKHAYGYSGQVTLPTSGTESFFLFNTLESYIDGLLHVDSTAASGANIDLDITFNGILVFRTELASDFQLYPNFSRPLEILIPPYTEVDIKASVQGATPREWLATFRGKVGMAPRVGNLVE
jgi:hypothetical protein